MNPELPDLAAALAPALAAHATPATRAVVTAAVAALARERAAGDVCMPLALLRPDGGPDDLRAGLLASGVCGRPGDAGLPLVLDERDRLYLLRDFANERRIVAALAARLAAPPLVPAAEVRSALAARGELDRSREPAADGEPDWQLAAIASAALGHFTLLTGGPGTGKTTTVARLLALLHRLDPGLRIALCAPTGKAAARLGEAIAQRAERDPDLRALQPRLEPRTLHRLLGYRALDDDFRYGRERPLPYDVVAVDEASMLDPALLAVLLEAMPQRSRLLLVGDDNQLAAIAAGQVLGDLCRAATPGAGVGERLAAQVAETTDVALPVRRGAPAIADAVVQLRTNHRFGAQPGLDHFARALALRDADGALAVLAAGHPDLVPLREPAAVLEALADELLAAVRAEADDALAGLGRLRILAASRHGERGTAAWNARVEALLAARGVRVDDPWYPGRPVLVTANDYQNRIFNGDLGVACRAADGRPQVAFRAPDGSTRRVSAFRLPAHETAWAMTVHKSQGSEFDTVVLSMPESDGPLWQAPLLYTGITRARRRALLIGDEELLRSGVGRWPNRSSGLADALAAQ